MLWKNECNHQDHTSPKSNMFKTNSAATRKAHALVPHKVPPAHLKNYRCTHNLQIGDHPLLPEPQPPKEKWTLQLKGSLLDGTFQAFMCFLYKVIWIRHLSGERNKLVPCPFSNMEMSTWKFITRKDNLLTIILWPCHVPVTSNQRGGKLYTPH